MTARNAVGKSGDPPSNSDFCVNHLMEKWGLDKQHPKFQREMKTVLMELTPEAQLSLADPRLQVEVTEGGEDVWAYFPVSESEAIRPVSDDEIRDLAARLDIDPDYNWEKCLELNRRVILTRVTLRPATRILLELGSQMFNGRLRAKSGTDATIELQDHLGHTLLYLRQSEARNHCADAEHEWKQNLAVT